MYKVYEIYFSAKYNHQHLVGFDRDWLQSWDYLCAQDHTKDFREA